ncbi:MAG: CHAT domain-containing protein [Flavobacteriaceae bacterium]
MKKALFILFLIYRSTFLFSQNLEETIYVTAETFISNQNEISLQILNTQELAFKEQVKTKDEQLALVFLQTHKAYYFFQKSNLEEAIKTYEAALKRFNDNELSKISEFDIIENCLKPLGTLYTKTGDFTNALITINQYIFIAEKSKNTKHQISGHINLAKLYYSLGKYDIAIKTIDDTFKLKNITKTQKALLQNIKTESLVALNQSEKAAFLNSSIKSSTVQKEKNNYLIQLQNGNYQEALASFGVYKSFQLNNKTSSRDLAQLYIEQAQLYYVSKQPDKALNNLNLAIKTLLPNFNNQRFPEKNMLYAENKFIAVFDLYAEIETNSEIALQSLDLSFYVADLLKNNWTSQETKILNESDNRVRSEKCIEILYDAFNQTKNKSLLIKALHYAENNKSSVLKDIFLKKIRLQHIPNDSLLIKEFNLLKEQERVTSLLVKEVLNSTKINDLSKQLSAISMQLKSFKTAISIKYSDHNTIFYFETLKAKLIEDHATLTEYFYGKNNIYQFIVSDDDIVLNRIPQDEKNKERISNFINLFNSPSTINNDIQNFTKQAFDIYKLLKFDSLSTYKNVLIIPDGLLNFIPFEALLNEETNTSTFSKMPFVVTNQKIGYNSSIFLYLNNVNKPENNTVLGVFPVFENTKKALTYSINEAKAIESEMKSHILMRTEATKANFNKKASNYGILHLSTHASSGDFVNPSNLSFYDDTLFLNELYSLDLNTNLVVLSACETGIGKLYKGEGAMSIARGFQYAGAQNLLFSLWQINDLSTSQIMQKFYKNFNKHHSAFFANNESKVDYLKNESISNAKKSPYYWSAFVYYGEILQPNSKNLLIYICLAALFILIAVFLFIKLKRA